MSGADDPAASVEVLVVGSANVDLVVRADHIPRPGETVLGGDLRRVPGGKGANQAVAAARLGRRVALCCRLGDDDAGRLLTDSLSGAGVDLSRSRVDTGVPSGTALITVDTRGDNAIVVSPGANRLLTADEVRRAVRDLRPRVVLASLEIPVDALDALIDAEGLVVVDPAPTPAGGLPGHLLSRVDVLVPNRGELTQLAGGDPGPDPEALADAARGLGVARCVVTLGAEGALVVEPDAWTHVPAPHVTPVDTTAAGDAFAAALCDALVGGRGLVDATRWAVRVGTAATLVAGAQPCLPTPDEVQSRLASAAAPLRVTAPPASSPAAAGTPADDARTQRPRVLLDCDPGIDDALAILTAAHHTDLVAITTVNGNVGVEATTRNALLVCEAAGLDVPVHRGAARPLVAPPLDAARIHGREGLGPVRGDPRRRAASDRAVDFLIETVRSSEIHIVATGPLTNLALAVRLAPDLPARWASLTVMGGAVGGGNVTPAAEFNVWADPEAAAIVLHEGGPLTLVGLDVTTRSRLTVAHVAALRSAGHRAADLAADLVSHGIERVRSLRGEDSVPMHDATAVMALVRPDLFDGRELPLTVELTGSSTRGATVVDRRADRDADTGPGGRVRVLTDVDGATVADLVVASIVELGRGRGTSSATGPRH